jgi:hypothetical protein
VGGGGNKKAGLPPLSSIDLHMGAAPCVDNLATFCKKYSNLLASVYLHRSPKEMDTWHSICATNRMNTQIENGHFVGISMYRGNKNTFFTKQTHKCVILG